MTILHFWTTTLLLAAFFGNAQGKFWAVFDSCKMNILHPSLKANCSIIAEDLISVYFTILEQYAAVYGNVTMQMAYRGSYATVFDLTEANYCKIYATDAPLAFNLFKDMRNKTNLFKVPQYCPFKVGDYYMKNMRLSSENFPLNFPPLLFKVTFTTYVPRKGKKLEIVSGEVLGRIKKN